MDSFLAWSFGICKERNNGKYNRNCITYHNSRLCLFSYLEAKGQGRMYRLPLFGWCFLSLQGK